MKIISTNWDCNQWALGSGYLSGMNYWQKRQYNKVMRKKAYMHDVTTKKFDKEVYATTGKIVYID